ncbi:hypothetical protein ACFOD9_13925 [Novosphingobium bradum]|uniref:Uncharacterized protein n=1 Tax=Novosphingobium bradum TaxID=1737444 RepID=A0ABV7IRN4_9SPHN
MSDKRRLARLKRLETVRAVARQAAAAEAAEAEGTLAQLMALAERTGRLAADYAARAAPEDGDGLRRLAGFRSGLAGVEQATRADAARAQRVADARLGELSQAERRRAAAADRAEAVRRAIAAVGALPPLGARKAIGTDLD